MADAPAETLIARVEQRRGDASDADRRVVKEQLGYDLGEIAWHHGRCLGLAVAHDSSARRLRLWPAASGWWNQDGGARELAGPQAVDGGVGVGEIEGGHVRPDGNARRDLEKLGSRPAA